MIVWLKVVDRETSFYYVEIGLIVCIARTSDPSDVMIRDVF